jgi:hypothetical protein
MNKKVRWVERQYKVVFQEPFGDFVIPSHHLNAIKSLCSKGGKVQAVMFVQREYHISISDARDIVDLLVS